MQLFEIITFVILFAGLVISYLANKTIFQIILSILIVQVVFSLISVLGAGAVNMFNFLIYSAIVLVVILIIGFILKIRWLKIFSSSALIYTIYYFLMLAFLLIRGLS